MATLSCRLRTHMRYTHICVHVRGPACLQLPKEQLLRQGKMSRHPGLRKGVCPQDISTVRGREQPFLRTY